MSDKGKRVTLTPARVRRMLERERERLARLESDADEARETVERLEGTLRRLDGQA